MGYLLPEFPGCPPHCVGHLVVLNHMAPTGAAALRAEELLEPFVAEDKHRIGINDQLCCLSAYSPLLKLVGLQQVQVVLLAGALDQLLRMSRTEQISFSWAAIATG